MPLYDPENNETYWSERALLSVASEAGSLDMDGQLTELGLGRFLNGLADMRKDGKGAVNIRGEHPAYIKNRVSRQRMRDFIEDIVFDLAAASERYCDSPLLVLGVRGEKPPPDASCTPEYMLKTILQWRVPHAFKQVPGVEDAINEFLAKIAVLMKDHPAHFQDRHAFSNSVSDEDKILKYISKPDFPRGGDVGAANGRYAYEPVTPPPLHMCTHSSPQKGSRVTHLTRADGSNIPLLPNSIEEEDAFKHMGDSARKARASKTAMKQKVGAPSSPSSFTGIPGGPTGDAVPFSLTQHPHFPKTSSIVSSFSLGSTFTHGSQDSFVYPTAPGSVIDVDEEVVEASGSQVYGQYSFKDIST